MRILLYFLRMFSTKIFKDRIFFLLTVDTTFASITLPTQARRSLTSTAVQTRVLTYVSGCHRKRIDRGRAHGRGRSSRGRGNSANIETVDITYATVSITVPVTDMFVSRAIDTKSVADRR